MSTNLTYIYYNPLSGNVSDTPTEESIAFINANDYGRLKEESEREISLYKHVIEEECKETLKAKSESEYHEKCDRLRYIYTLGCVFIAGSINHRFFCIPGIILCIVYVALRGVYYFRKYKYQDEISCLKLARILPKDEYKGTTEDGLPLDKSGKHIIVKE